MSLAFTAGAHTIPISYLRLAPQADYLHLEFVFNPFELSFISEVDDNKDGGLDPAELKAHGDAVAKRVLAALKITVSGRLVAPETAGMDPDLNGHHVRLRAHYKIDARRLPLTLESEFNSITSASHLMQVTYAAEGGRQLGQLDAQARKVTFDAPGAEGERPKPEIRNPKSERSPKSEVRSEKSKSDSEMRKSL